MKTSAVDAAKEGQQRKLLRRQQNFPAPNLYLLMSIVEQYFPVTQELYIFLNHARAAQHGLNPRNDLPGTERLRNIIISPQ